MKVDRQRFLAAHPEYANEEGELDIARSCCASASGFLDSPRQCTLLKETREFAAAVNSAHEKEDDDLLVSILRTWKYGHDPTSAPPELAVYVAEDGKVSEEYPGMPADGQARFLRLRTGLHTFNLVLFADVLDAVDAAIERNLRKGSSL